jgi:hypothetical protein
MMEDNKGIFVSYRRDETTPYAGWLADRLGATLGQQNVFRDIGSIEPGMDFVEAIERALGVCAVMLVLIGRSWATALKEREQPGQEDYTRLEVATALKRDNVRVIPVLVQEALMPRAEELPEDLVSLRRRQAVALHDTNWESDVAYLIAQVEKIIGSGEERTSEAAESSESTILQSLEWVDRPDTGIVYIVSTFAEIELLCNKGKVLLFTGRAGEGSGERNLLNKLLTNVLPQIAPIATSQGVIVCLSNIGGLFSLSDLAEYLQKRGLRFSSFSRACFLFQDGRILKYKKASVSDDKDMIKAAQELLED